MDLFGEASYTTGLSDTGETSALNASAGLKVTFKNSSGFLSPF